MARLIDADALQEVITQDWFLDILLTQTGKNDMAKRLVDMIDSVPLAYDVEKVVEEIKEYSMRTFGEIRTENTIEIVRKGGVE